MLQVMKENTGREDFQELGFRNTPLLQTNLLVEMHPMPASIEWNKSLDFSAISYRPCLRARTINILGNHIIKINTRLDSLWEKVKEDMLFYNGWGSDTEFSD